MGGTAIICPWSAPLWAVLLGSAVVGGASLTVDMVVLQAYIHDFR
jgi:hypothetical protein